MLSIEDRIAIQQLYARYCACMDTGDMRGWAHCFTEDGVFETFTNHRGRGNIEAYGADVMARRQTNAWTNGQHWNNNIIVEGDRDAARALCYLIVIGKMKDTGELRIVIQGWYRDELARENGQWKFKARRVSFDTPSPDVIPKAAAAATPNKS